MAMFSEEGAIIDLDDQLEDQDENEQVYEDEARLILNSWSREKIMKEIKEDAEKTKMENEDAKRENYDGERDFEEMAKDMTPLANNQVLINVFVSNPEAKEVQPSHTVLFERIGYLEYNLMPFESSICDGKPSLINLTQGPIFPGLLYALTNLREGDRASILIRPGMAYGRLGCPGLIPPDASLLYFVRIYKVFEESQLSLVLDYEKEFMTDIPFAEKLILVEEHKTMANKFLEDDMPKEALVRYKAGIKCLEDITDDEMRRSATVTGLLRALLCNSAIVYNKMGMHKSATKAAKRALFMDPRDIKSYYQLAKARIALADHSGALKWIEKGCKVCSNNSCFDQLKIQLDFKLKDESEKRRDIMKKMSKVFI